MVHSLLAKHKLVTNWLVYSLKWLNLAHILLIFFAETSMVSLTYHFPNTWLQLNCVRDTCIEKLAKRDEEICRAVR